VSSQPHWPWAHTKAWFVQYRAWDGVTPRQAVIVLPLGWGPGHHPSPLPLVISPHGRNNFAFTNAVHFWQNLPAQGPFALVCPDGLARAHDRSSDPFDLPPNPSLFTYGYQRHVDDLARMPKIVEATLPWLSIRLDRVFVLGSSMGGQETLLLAARYPHSLSGGHGRLAGAAAFDAVADLATQCGHLTHTNPSIAVRMIEEVGTRPADVSGWKLDAAFLDRRTGARSTVGHLVSQLPSGQAAWDGRSGLHFAQQLSSLRFPLRLYWSSADRVVINQDSEQTGRLSRRLKQLNPNARVTSNRGLWQHSTEFKPGKQLGLALAAFGLIEPGV
jgi:pimeloyl-ACP methyl ester carboxylesterase